MRLSLNSPAAWLFFIRALSRLVPAHSRSDWRREWDAEIVNRWQVLQKWNNLNMKSKLDLSKRVAGATHDVATFQHTPLQLVLVVLNILVALVLGFAAGKEFLNRGIRDGELQPLFLSSVAIVVSVLFIISAVAMFQQWTAVRRLVLITGVLSILVHIYGALPPHRNMGFQALLIGAGYALLMMFLFQLSRSRQA